MTSKSRELYEKKNPVVSIRLTKSLREKIDKVKGDMAYKQAVRMILTRFLDTFDTFEKANNLIQVLESEVEKCREENEALKSAASKTNTPADAIAH